MIPRMDRIVYFSLLLFFCTSAAFAQPYKKLTIDDFRGVPNGGNTGDVAFTYCSIEFSYKAKREDNYYLLTFNIKLVMNSDQSWMDKSKIGSHAAMVEILKHEQGHYNIAYMEQQELLRTVGRTVFHEDYQRVANAIFDRIDAKYKQLNLDYDADTGNSTNRVQQQSWNDYFDRKLAYMPKEQ